MLWTRHCPCSEPFGALVERIFVLYDERYPSQDFACDICIIVYLSLDSFAMWSISKKSGEVLRYTVDVRSSPMISFGSGLTLIDGELLVRCVRGFKGKFLGIIESF